MQCLSADGAKGEVRGAAEGFGQSGVGGEEVKFTQRHRGTVGVFDRIDRIDRSDRSDRIGRDELPLVRARYGRAEARPSRSHASAPPRDRNRWALLTLISAFFRHGATRVRGERSNLLHLMFRGESGGLDCRGFLARQQL